MNDAMPDTRLMQAAEQRARRWLEADGIETAQLDFLAEDILSLVGELRDLRSAGLAALAERVTDLEVRQREDDESAAERLEREA